jgi:hypothetical protein
MKMRMMMSDNEKLLLFLFLATAIGHLIGTYYGKRKGIETTLSLLSEKELENVGKRVAEKNE